MGIPLSLNGESFPVASPVLYHTREYVRFVRRAEVTLEMCVCIPGVGEGGRGCVLLEHNLSFPFLPFSSFRDFYNQKSFHGFTDLTRCRHRWPLWKPLSRVLAFGHSDWISHLWRDESHVDLWSDTTKDAMIRYVFESREQLSGETKITKGMNEWTNEWIACAVSSSSKGYLTYDFSLWPLGVWP